MSLHLRFSAGLLLFIALLSTAFAQTSRGSLSGTVADSQGALVPNASVTITQRGTNVTRQTTTNSAGIYRFDAVDLGTYDVSAKASGFATENKTGVQIESARNANIDFSLKVGNASEVVNVEASGFEVQLDTTEQTRGQHFETQAINNLPMVGADSLTLAQLTPGVALAAGGAINQNGTFAYSVNGQRPRGNNFMIDGVENNDISVTGPAFTITNPDAVQEVNIQTSNFSAEFGRAGGAVFNQITKSGTNGLHGTANWAYTGSAFKALNHNDAINHRFDPPRQVENIPYFSIGGPVVIPGLYNGHDKTFFFGAAQWDRLFGTTRGTVTVPDAAGLAVLQSLAGSCPNAALYIKALGGLVGDPTVTPGSINLNVPSAAGTCNGSTRTGMKLTTGGATLSEGSSSLDANHQIRIDHKVSEKQSMSFRWLYDQSSSGPSLNNLPGFDSQFVGTTLGGTFADTYVISSRWTNEFRFNYGRIGFNFPGVNSDPFHATLPNFGISGVTGFGVATNIPQFRFANNWQYQDTQTFVVGTHTFRYGVDFLRQLARQHPPFVERGSFAYQSSSGGVTAFSNFLDDFGGNSGALNRQFGSSIYHPNLFRQSYFFQDSWRTTSNLTLNLGLRYEYFGTPVNAFTTAAFTNYDPINFAAPSKVNADRNNFAPSVGFAWNPKGSNWLNRMMGGDKMVWRGGFQTTYDSSFNNLLSNIAGSSPNTLGGNITSVTSAGAPRGFANFSTLFAGITATPATAFSAQSNLFLKSEPNPYTDRWSFGFERELPHDLVFETSYVGSISHKLYRSIDMNPLIGDACGSRFAPQLQAALPGPCSSLTPAQQAAQAAIRSSQGIRNVRAASANSNYESLQMNLRGNLKSTPLGAFLFQGSYTYAHYLDDVSDVFGFNSTPSPLQSVSQVLGASPHIDYGVSDFDRRYVAAVAIVWDVRAPKTGLMGTFLGGWTISAIPHWESGQPYTLSNGSDRNKDGQTGPDRPDISNPAAPLNTRAVRNSGCATGFSNPDLAGACVDPSTVHFIEGIGLPNANTVGRNTLRAPATDTVDVSIAKRFRINERSAFEYRVDMFNALNTINLGGVPARTINSNSVVNPGQPVTFLNPLFSQSIGRSMQMRLRLTW
ncbi:MAG TPA: carboxypeptidase regulatory-like domain-containing protein [Candidatus Angelobacter sp.]|nr:carboxypeptidase regulatory-like domain-containing protein [Candidatus Angelobacter sp.]